ncbi:MAG TPA: disulfide bond formation protein DsbA [Mycobacteriales bacterium]|jgi:2-hydroxychromene-2-carboxylate isomerase|nr:disulfide bond formation protein DsbA [Mycobacteriales bacterium]
MRDDVTFWFDPGCPWTWATSRWLVAAAEQRDLRVTWRLMSLSVLNAGREFEPWIAFGARVLRVFAAVADAHGSDAVGALFTAYGHRIHDLKDPFEPLTLEKSLADAGLPPILVAAMDAPAWDDAVRADHDAAQAAAGGEAGSPVMAYRGTGWFGPVLSPAPRGEAAGELWDDLTRFITRDGVFEVKRGRDRGPRVG